MKCEVRNCQNEADFRIDILEVPGYYCSDHAKFGEAQGGKLIPLSVSSGRGRIMKIPLVSEDWFLEKIDDAPSDEIGEGRLALFLFGSIALLLVDFIVLANALEYNIVPLYFVFLAIFIWVLAVPARLFTKWVVESL